MGRPQESEKEKRGKEKKRKGKKKRKEQRKREKKKRKDGEKNYLPCIMKKRREKAEEKKRKVSFRITFLFISFLLQSRAFVWFGKKKWSKKTKRKEKKIEKKETPKRKKRKEKEKKKSLVLFPFIFFLVSPYFEHRRLRTRYPNNILEETLKPKYNFFLFYAFFIEE